MRRLLFECASSMRGCHCSISGGFSLWRILRPNLWCTDKHRPHIHTQPHMVAWHWHRRPDDVVNSFFMYACHDSIAVGGGTDFALWLDADLEHGHSGPCDTFGSPGLGSEEDFGLGHLELWAPQ